MNGRQTRREFLKSTYKKAIVLGAASRSLSAVTKAYGASEKSKIVIVRNDRAINDDNICNRKEAGLMLEKALFSITGKNNAKDAWASLGVTQNDVVGIKVNCNGSGFLLNAHPELVYALCESLSSVIPLNNIIIYERYTSELTRIDFKANKSGSGVRCIGTNEGGGFHPQEELTKIITDTCTKLINFPSLKTFGSNFAGTLFLKNHIGSLHPSHMPRCHGNTNFITEVNARPSIKNKTILAVCDGLRGTFRKSVPWYWKGIIMGRDPVAAEYTALNIINEKRKQENLNEFSVPGYVKLAETKYNLGTCDPSKIDMETLEL